jgi:DNA-directed RNA polymerase specialized sigma24 family protein
VTTSNVDGVPLDEAVIRVVRLVEGRGDASSSDLDVVVQALERLVRYAYPAVAHEASDIAEEAVVRLVHAIRRGLLDRQRSPTAYLKAIARNEAVSRLRSPRSETRSVVQGEEDPNLYTFLNRHAAKTDIDSAWVEAKRRTDNTVLRVVASWLDLSAELGRAPTTREVGRLAGVSHTAVRQALDRFKSYFPERLPST